MAGLSKIKALNAMLMKLIGSNVNARMRSYEGTL